jgi:hypothetical protein
MVLFGGTFAGVTAVPLARGNLLIIKRPPAPLAVFIRHNVLGLSLIPGRPLSTELPKGSLDDLIGFIIRPSPRAPLRTKAGAEAVADWTLVLKGREVEHLEHAGGVLDDGGPRLSR